MKLIDLLVQELPNRGGWPDDCQVIAQDEDRQLAAYHPKTHEFIKYYHIYLSERCDKYRVRNTKAKYSAEMVTREQYEAALAAAQQPVWDGEGLPPVGCECEFFDCEKWFKVTMMYGGSQLVVLYDHDNQIERSFSTSRIDGKFRPIRSEDDKKRDDAIAKITDAICGEIADTGWVTAEKYAARAYDAIAAGKIPHVKLSD